MCGSYTWTPIGNAWYAQFPSMGFQIINSDGTLLGFSVANPCWQISKTSAKSTLQANNDINAAWNYAVDKCVQRANSTPPVLDDYRVKANFTQDINAYLSENFGASASFNPTGCSGNIAYSKVQTCIRKP